MIEKWRVKVLVFCQILVLSILALQWKQVPKIFSFNLNENKHHQTTSHSRVKDVSTTSEKLNSAGPIINQLDKLKDHIKLTELSNSSSIPQAPKQPTTVRPTYCEECFQRRYRFIINSEQICKTPSNTQINLLIFIHTSHGHQDRRNAIRKTWTSPSMNNTSPQFRYVFLLGSSQKEHDEIIQSENNVHHDIALQDFKDAYKNLTLKTLMGFHWYSRFCSNAKYVMKTDDDMYVNVSNILRIIKQPSMQGKILGHCYKTANPIRGKSKWSASHLQYPQKTYPGFCHGLGYVMSGKTARNIDVISKNVPFFYLEDVYVSLCANELGIPLQNVDGFNGYAFPFSGHKCGKYGSENLFATHGLTPQTMSSVWKICVESNKKTA